MASEIPNKEEQHSSSELLASAKLVAEAAQSTLKNESESDKLDKAKVADAAGDLLDAAAQYGKLDDQKGIGQYVDKAADYLHHYQNTNAPSKPAQDSKEPHTKKPEGGSGGGGLGGDIAKLAGGFFK